MALELLAPAGTPAAFKAALAAGADAIYCAPTQDFNARHFAEGFTFESFEELTREAHLAGVRVFVTTNIVIKHGEFARAIEHARRAYLAGADAFIVQDFGLLRELKRAIPGVEIHISTQSNIHDARATKACAELLGAERVTLSRELSVTEIAHIAQTGVDVECFGHGAICFCYSGICHMSSYFGGRSANRGLCAQPCRLPFELLDDKGRSLAPVESERLLCPKDFCTIDELDRMIAAGVTSLKIEGRMKGGDYVHSVVRAYRGAIDDASAGKLADLGQDALRKRLLRRVFNRDFTSSYLDGESDNSMMSYERSNNRGEIVGSVSASKELEDELVVRVRENGKTRLRRHTRAELSIELKEPVGEGDLLEIRPKDDPSQFFTVHAPESKSAGETLVCVGVRSAAKGSVVRVIRSQELMHDASFAETSVHPKKRPVNVHIRAKLAEPLQIELETLDGVRVCVKGDVLEAARTRAVSADDLIEHVGRMGASIFLPLDFTLELDEGIGIGFSRVHALRAEAVDKLEELLLAPYKRSLEPYKLSELTRTGACEQKHAPQVCALVSSPEAAAQAALAGATRIYAHGDALLQGTWPQDTIPWLDEICREIDHERIDPQVQAGKSLAAGNISELVLAREKGAYAELESCIPVHNAYAAAELQDLGASGLWLSPELSLEEIREFVPLIDMPVGLSVSGRQRLMTSEHCVLSAAEKCSGVCESCAMRTRKHYLRNIDGHMMPVVSDTHGRSRIYSAKSLDITAHIKDLLQAGITRFMADATLLTPEETFAEVKRVKLALDAVLAENNLPERAENTTTGHLFAPIG